MIPAVCAASVAVLALLALLGLALNVGPGINPATRDRAALLAVGLLITGLWWAVALAAGVRPGG